MSDAYPVSAASVHRPSVVPPGTAASVHRPSVVPPGTAASELASRILPAPPESCLRVLQDFHSEFSLNIRPTLALGLPLVLLFGALALFLEVYVLACTAEIQLAVFLVGAYVVFSTYFVANHYMGRFSDSYKSIPEDKKFYVLSNLIKSAVLLAYCPSAAYTLWRALYHDEWSTPRIRNMGVLYAIPDAVSLALVARMAFTTKVHHLCVVLFMVVNLYVTYEEETVGRALVVYGVFSTFAYLVNLLLASRFLPVSPLVSLSLATLALLIYGGCLGINWVWQVAFLYRLVQSKPSWGHAASIMTYLALISMVVRDDCVLIQWLWQNVGKTWARVVEKHQLGSPAKKKDPSSPLGATDPVAAKKSE